MHVTIFFTKPPHSPTCTGEITKVRPDTIVSSKGPLWVYPQLNTPIIYPVYMYWKADSLLVSQPKGGLQSSEIKYKPLPPLQTLDAPAPPTKYRPDTIVFQERNWDTVIPAITLLDLIHNWSWIDSIHGGSCHILTWDPSLWTNQIPQMVFWLQVSYFSVQPHTYQGLSQIIR